MDSDRLPALRLRRKEGIVCPGIIVKQILHGLHAQFLKKTGRLFPDPFGLEDNFQGSVLFYHGVGSGEQTPLVRFDSECFNC